LKILEEERKMPFITSVERIGYERGQKEAIEEIVLKMLKDRVPLETIAKFTDLSISELERFANEHNEEIQSQQQ
jgi:predicted transposase YdaD